MHPITSQYHQICTYGTEEYSHMAGILLYNHLEVENLLLSAYRTELTRQLRGNGLDLTATTLITDDVINRLLSIVSRYEMYRAFRDPLLLTVAEQAVDWTPRWVSGDVRALIALCVRNSLVEDYHTTAGGQRAPISNKAIRRIIHDALRFFGRIDKAALSTGLQVNPVTNVYGSLSEQFPLAWRVLSVLALLPVGQIEGRFEVMRGTKPQAFPFWTPTLLRVKTTASVVVSGMDAEFEPELVKYLYDIWWQKVPFYFTDSFKTISRRPEKLLAVVDSCCAVMFRSSPRTTSCRMAM